jgi:hypothetical protein
MISIIVIRKHHLFAEVDKEADSDYFGADFLRFPMMPGLEI